MKTLNFMKKQFFPKIKLNILTILLQCARYQNYCKSCVSMNFSQFMEMWKWWNAHQRDSKLSWKCHFEELSKGEVLMSWCA